MPPKDKTTTGAESGASPTAPAAPSVTSPAGAQAQPIPGAVHTVAPRAALPDVLAQDQELAGTEREGVRHPLPERLQDRTPERPHTGARGEERDEDPDLAGLDARPRPAFGPTDDDLSDLVKALPPDARRVLLEKLAAAHGVRIDAGPPGATRRHTGRWVVRHQIKITEPGAKEQRIAKVGEVVELSPEDVKVFTTLDPISIDPELV